MRTRTHFCIGEGTQGLTAVLSGHFPRGEVAVVGDQPLLMHQVAATLKKRYKVELFPIETVDEKPPSAGFVLGVGSPEIIPFVRKFSGKTPFAFYATTVDFCYLNNYDGSGRLSEFAYVDRVVDLEKARSAYASLFLLWCEASLRRFEKSRFPYRDAVLAGVGQSAERALSGETDEREFLPETLRLIGALNAALADYPVLYVRRASLLGNAPEEQFICSYFLISLLKTFTKFSVHAILNPSANATQKVSYDPSVLPDEQKLKSYASRMRAMKDFPDVNVKELYRLLSAVACPELPLLRLFKGVDLFKGEP